MKKREEKKEVGKNKSKNRANIIAFLVILLIVEAYLIMLYYFDFNFLSEISNILEKLKGKECETKTCFEKALEKCEKAKYVYDAQNIWLYEIKSKKQEKCLVSVELLQIKYGILESRRLEGKKMVCEIPLGSVEMPGSDLSKCSGELKEEVQQIIIEKMHSYIIENIGKISKELEKFL